MARYSLLLNFIILQFCFTFIPISNQTPANLFWFTNLKMEKNPSQILLFTRKKHQQVLIFTPSPTFFIEFHFQSFCKRSEIWSIFYENNLHSLSCRHVLIFLFRVMMFCLRIRFLVYNCKFPYTIQVFWLVFFVFI